MPPILPLRSQQTNQGLLHTHTRINRIPATERVYTGSLLNVAKCTSEKQDGIPLRDTEHTAAEEILRSHPLSSTPTSRTTKSTGRQPNSWHTRRIREAIEIFKHHTVPQDIGFFISDIWRPYYGPNDLLGPKDLLYPKSTTQPRLRDLLHPTKSTTLPPSPCAC